VGCLPLTFNVLRYLLLLAVGIGLSCISQCIQESEAALRMHKALG
jgi:hypothetical protein